ncbi:MAG: hypothetical protein GX591_02565 [Planctomycetes bacterium]|nr:hypothetical protein [Planctomycetota bacterium]
MKKADCLWVSGIVFLSVFAGAGCRAVSRPDVIVTLDAVDSRGASPTVEVHLIGVNNQGRYLNLRDMTAYDWNAMRAGGEAYVMKFGNDTDRTLTLDSGDPIWRAWDRPRQLFVIASFPPGQDGQGPRRLVLPLKWNSWIGKDIPISIQQTGLVCQERYKAWNPFED